MAKVTKAQRAKVAKALNKLLAERRISDGGYAPATEQDIDQIHVLFCTIIEAKWGSDPDGDLPVEYKLINRHTEERLHYYPIPYGHRLKDFEAMRNRVSLLMANLDMAQEAVSKMMRGFMDYDMPRIGLTYRNWYMGGAAPHQRGHYWAASSKLFKGRQVVEVTHGQPTGRGLVVRLPGQDEQISLDEIKLWGPQVLNFDSGPLPWGDSNDEK
ncbi:hypothetical protein LCGC14_0164580 [marine sediment metagenome]|uniref:Uncharacterized protein n=1 Tax=marine sediment metagenome TaxID=412755 RepID=A0A0F9UYM2_9ZZZZ